MKAIRTFLHDFTTLPRDLKLLSAALFNWGLGESLFLTLIALYLKSLGASPVQIGNIYGFVAAIVAFAAIPSGILADRWGRKPTLLLGWLVGLIGVVLMAAASDIYWFAAGMAAYWLSSIALPAMSSYVAAGRGTLPPERALTIVSAGFGLGAILSPAVGGWIAAEFGFRMTFIVGGAIYALSGVLIPLLHAQPTSAAGKSARLGGLLANRRFLGFCALIVGMWFVLYLPMPLSANFLAEVRGFTVGEIGLLGTVGAIGLTVLNLTLGRLLPRRGFLVAQAFVGLFLVIMLRASWFGWIALAYFARPAAFVSRTLAEAMATRVVRREQWGLAFGTLETVATLATILAPPLAGRLYVSVPARPFQLSLILLPLVMLVSYFVVPRLSHAPVEEAHEVDRLSAAVEDSHS